MANEISSALEGFVKIGHEETAWGTLSGKMIELPIDTDRIRITHDLTKIYAKAGVGDRWAANLVTVGRKLGALTLPGAFLADISTLLWWATIGHDKVEIEQAGKAWKHTLTYLNEDDPPVHPIPPSVSVQVYEGDKADPAEMKQFLGGVVKSATLEWDASADDGVLDNTFELVSEAPTLVNKDVYTDPLFKPLPSWSIGVAMNEVGAEPTTFNDVVRCSATWENNAEMVKTAIGANAPSDRAYGEALVTGRMVILFRNMVEYTRWETGVQTVWEITATDPVAITGTDPAVHRSCKMFLPVVDYQILEVQKLGAFKVANVTFKAMRCATLKAAAKMEIVAAVENWAV